MKIAGKAFSGCLFWLIIVIVFAFFSQLAISNYVNTQKKGDKKQINSIISGKLPDNLQCIREIKIENQELTISLDTQHYRCDKKILESPAVFRSNSSFPVIIYDSCTYANNESFYMESLSLEGFDGKSAKFLTTVTYEGDKNPEVHKREFVITDSFLRGSN